MTKMNQVFVSVLVLVSRALLIQESNLNPRREENRVAVSVAKPNEIYVSHFNGF